ncbi:hypothetical protein AB7C87_04135 [Natrarchaeobius sp. A-rgal3]|uniref:hypothetical protein n=1 Tax=Natrarchaeobius versutus TaxID=1679078 RepID=UPI0035101C4F
MIEANVVVAGVSLVLAVFVGLVAHEGLHALVLRLARVEYTVVYGPDRTGGALGMLASCPWALVRPYPTGDESPWIFRISALAPLALAALVFGLVGFDLVSLESPVSVAVAIGILGCSIPSPQDFSVAFYAHRLLEEVDDTFVLPTHSRAD